MDKIEVGIRLKTWALEKFKNRAEFARALGIPSQSLSDYFNGKTSPGGIMRDKLKALGADVDWILTGEKKERKWWGKVDPAKLPPARGVENLPPNQTVKLMLSPVAAGDATDVYPDVQADIPVGKHYHEKSYMIQAVGESMKGAGIVEGDWLLIDEEREPQNGNIVIARVGDRLTVKRLKKNGECWLLNPENSDFDPIPCNADVDIVAVVIKKEIMFV